MLGAWVPGVPGRSCAALWVAAQRAASSGTHGAREPGSWAVGQHSCCRLLLQLTGLRPSALPPPPQPRTDHPCRYRESTRGFGWYDWLGWFLPCFVWLREYNIRGWLLVSRRAGGWLIGWVVGCVAGSLYQRRRAAEDLLGCIASLAGGSGSCCAFKLAKLATAQPGGHSTLPPRLLTWPSHYYFVLQSDVAAGLSVGAMVIPQGMSYARLAGLPQGALHRRHLRLHEWQPELRLMPLRCGLACFA